MTTLKVETTTKPLGRASIGDIVKFVSNLNGKCVIGIVVGYNYHFGFVEVLTTKQTNDGIIWDVCNYDNTLEADILDGELVVYDR